ncbi:RNA polymerase sigma factor [Desulfosporosinus sp.]|uniref:RNA polymerase sigma factor n=1 Tax=Desulfosporosinus sp. TaxID=157907 RepID=UPI002605AD8A|nr:RNA polymerase sigma factor [Desulfosporosinus sp.]
MIKRAKMGDKEVIIELILRQKQDYYRLAYTFMKNEDDALDVMEDMILKVYENIKKLNDDTAFYSWSKTILVNCCKNNLRRKNRVILISTIPEGSHEDVFQVKDEQLDIEKHMKKLNQKHLEVLKLRYYLDMDYESIAAILKIPLGTVKSRIHTGLLKLKQSMGVSN